MTNHLKITAFALPVMAAAMLGFTSTANATPVTFVGSTTVTMLPSVSGGGLTFTGASLNITTDANGNSGVFSLGSFSIDTSKNYGDVDNAVTLSMNLGGAGVVVDTFDTEIANYFNGFYWNHYNTIFGNVGFQTANPGSPTPPEFVSYSNASGSGSFYLTILGYPQFETLFANASGNDWGWKAAYSSGSPINVQITNARFTPVAPAPTPEPSSLVLLGTGILGLAGLVSRKALTKVI